MRYENFSIGSYSGIISIPGDKDTNECWIDDNFPVDIRFTSPNKPSILAIQISVRNSYTGYETFLYNTTTQSHILFDISDNIKNGLQEGVKIDSFSITITFTNISFTSFTYTLIVNEGKSFITKPHGSSDVILLYNQDELSNIEIWAPFSSNANINGNTYQVNHFTTLDLSGEITSEGEYTMCLEPADKATLPPIVDNITDQYITPYSSEILWEAAEQEAGDSYPGNIWSRCEQDKKCYTIIYEEPCCDFPFVELKYWNTDGCDRYIGGKLLNENDSSKYKMIVSKYQYDPFNASPWQYNEVRNVNNYFSTENSKVLRVGVKDVPAGLELNDIVYSKRLWMRDYSGNWIHCVLNDFNVNYNNQDSKIMLEVIVNKL